LSRGPTSEQGRQAIAAAQRTHGVYERRFAEDEVRTLLEAQTPDGDALTYEIGAARIMLDRALALWQRWASSDAEQLELVEQVEDGQATTSKRRRPDLFAIIDRCARTVAVLVERQARVVEVRDLQEQLEAMKGRLPRVEAA